MLMILIVLFIIFAFSNGFQLKKTMLVKDRLKLSMSTADDSSKNELIIAGTANVANLICGYSLYVLKDTGCGLPPGPFGIEGAAEGVSYLEVVFIVAWSLLTKIQTGGGLNEGPYGLLGLAEGLSYLTVIGGVIIAVLNLNDYGFLPGFLPNEQCFGINN